MGCWHGHGYGCGPGPYWVAPRGWYGPLDEDAWYDDVNWPMRRRARRRPVDREERVERLEARLEELRDELRRVEAALDELDESTSAAPSE